MPPLITAATAKSILDGRLRVSLDLGLSWVEVSADEGGVRLPGGFTVGFEDLKRIAGRGDDVFFFDGGSLRQVAVWDGRFYKLVPTAGAPTVEIDGVRMHRTKGVTPDVDALRKVEALGVGGGRVLDTCTGLGYTAVASLRCGGELVISIELRSGVIRMAEINPWSAGLFGYGRVHLIIGDAYHVVDALPDRFFDYVVHDPPRFAHAGRLYGGEFYRKVHRVLREGGRIFHYTGEPGSRYRRVDLRKGVMRRLGLAGFRRLRYHDEILGVTGERAGR
jgi:hypothetical protein